MLDDLINEAIDFLPKRLQWVITGVVIVLLLALLGYLWSQGRLTW